MITYELAKELKDAEFPQFTNERSPINSPSSYDRGTDGGIVFLPTLSDLIEACMGFYYPSHFNMGGMETWWAVLRGEGNQEAIVPVQTGKTPEEAVAKLWLALNAK